MLLPNELNVAEEQIIDGEMVEEVRALTPRQQYANSLRALADFFESQMEVPLPTLRTRIDLFGLPVDAVAGIAKAFGSSKKEYIGESFFVLKKEFGPLLSLEANWDRERVCTRVVTGQKTVARQVSAAYTTINETIDVVEWRCTDPVLAPRKVTAALPDGSAPATSTGLNEEVPY